MKEGADRDPYTIRPISDCLPTVTRTVFRPPSDRNPMPLQDTIRPPSDCDQTAILSWSDSLPTSEDAALGVRQIPLESVTRLVSFQEMT